MNTTDREEYQKNLQSRLDTTLEALRINISAGRLKGGVSDKYGTLYYEFEPAKEEKAPPITDENTIKMYGASYAFVNRGDGICCAWCNMKRDDMENVQEHLEQHERDKKP